jgi:DNA-binding response OmpR family regulator
VTASDAAAEPPGEKEIHMPAKVLLSEGQRFRTPVKSLLESHGYEALEPSPKRKGLRMVVEHRPDAILLDIMMGSRAGISGSEIGILA